MTIKNTGVPVDDPERPTPDGDEQAVTAVRGRRVRSVLWGTVPVLTFVVLLGAWALAVRLFKIPQYLLPGPEDVLPRIGEDWTSLWQNSVVTIKEILFGFGLTIVTAIPLGLLIALSAVGRRLVYPLLVFIQLVPKIAIAPLFLVWFGFGMSSKVVLTLLMTFFPLLLASISGFQILDQRLLYLTRSMGAGRWQTFRYLRFPSALPVIFSGLKTAATIAATVSMPMSIPTRPMFVNSIGIVLVTIFSPFTGS